SGCVHVASTAACDDGNPCTDDTCSPSSGCAHTDNSAPCSDNNPCTTGDSCSQGACAGGPPPSCDDGDPCTVDSCHPASGPGGGPAGGDSLVLPRPRAQRLRRQPGDHLRRRAADGKVLPVARGPTREPRPASVAIGIWPAGGRSEGSTCLAPPSFRRRAV